jgi:hypothetical protein
MLGNVTPTWRRAILGRMLMQPLKKLRRSSGRKLS